MRAYLVQASMKARPNGVRAAVRRGTTPCERISSLLEYMHPSLSKLLNDVRTSTLGSLLTTSWPRQYAGIASSGSLHAQTAFEEPSGLIGLASSIAARFLTSSLVISAKTETNARRNSIPLLASPPLTSSLAQTVNRRRLSRLSPV